MPQYGPNLKEISSYFNNVGNLLVRTLCLGLIIIPKSPIIAPGNIGIPGVAMRPVLAFLFVLASCVFSLAKSDPVHVIISMKDQSLRVFKGGEVIARSNVSTGKAGYSTPTGIFSILHKRRYHYSNIYGGAPMPFMQRLTWSGIALHASNSVPRYPASHGCVRLPHGFARKLFSLTSSGAHVVIARDQVAPEFVKHDFLFQPETPYAERTDMDRWLIEHVDKTEAAGDAKIRALPLRILITRRTQRQEVQEAQEILNSLGFNVGVIDGVIGPGTRGAIRNFETSLGRQATGEFDANFLTALFAATGRSRPANGHIFVRRNFNPVFDAPINIRDPKTPLGAHLVTAMDFSPVDTRTAWLSVSLQDRQQVPVYTDDGPVASDFAERRSLQDALSRLEIGEEVRRHISTMLTPGSSISISDNGISLETTPKGSDFIVVTKR